MDMDKEITHKICINGIFKMQSGDNFEAISTPVQIHH